MDGLVGGRKWTSGKSVKGASFTLDMNISICSPCISGCSACARAKEKERQIEMEIESGGAKEREREREREREAGGAL